MASSINSCLYSLTATFTLAAEKARWILCICPTHEFTQNKTVRPAVLAVTSYIFSLCQVGLIHAALKHLEVKKSLQNEKLFPTGPYLFGLFLFPSSGRSAPHAFDLPSACGKRDHTYVRFSLSSARQLLFIFTGSLRTS